MGKLDSPTTLLKISGAPWKGVTYGCTTRSGGVSTGPWEALNLGLHVGDNPAIVHENRRRLAEHLPAEPFWLEQVHGTKVVEVNAASPRSSPQADAAVTIERGVVLAIMTADCLPIVIADDSGRVLGVAHAGWRGLAAGILDCTVAALKTLHSGARSWRAWMGPCIGPRNFEVGDDVRNVFVGKEAATAAFFGSGKRPGKWQADLAGLARHRLVSLGVEQVENSGLCTYAGDQLFFSYRRERTCGRMATLAWLDADQRD